MRGCDVESDELGRQALRDLLELFLYRMWKADADKILTREEVVISGFIDDADESVVRRKLIFEHRVELSKFE
ncbi:MAG: hypothetical protein ABI779_09180 [Acidobacteriota bacterium]